MDCLSRFPGFAVSSALLLLGVHLVVSDQSLADNTVNTGCYVSDACTSIFLYADDILLLAPSVSSLQKLMSACEEDCIFWTCVSMIKSRFVYIFVTSMMCVVRSATMGRYMQIGLSGYLFFQCSVVQMYFRARQIQILQTF